MSGVQVVSEILAEVTSFKKVRFFTHPGGAMGSKRYEVLIGFVVTVLRSFLQHPPPTQPPKYVGAGEGFLCGCLITILSIVFRYVRNRWMHNLGLEIHYSARWFL